MKGDIASAGAVNGAAIEPCAALACVPGGWTTSEIAVHNYRFLITRPAAPDAFLEDPGVQAAHARDGYMPYWGYLWPTSLEMAAAVLDHDWPAGTPALEIGAGIGLTGLAGLARGLSVTFSDYDVQAVDLALHNARQNGWSRARGLVLDWRSPSAEQFPVIFGCDVIYERQNHAPILALLGKMLAPAGQCWIADPGRHQADAFLADARTAGFDCALRAIARLPFPSRPAGVTNLWVLTQR